MVDYRMVDCRMVACCRYSRRTAKNYDKKHRQKNFRRQVSIPASGSFTLH
ncbi:hypothetical protein HMPREF1548_04677 [Clostridium sp. KLE 1755]|nr:hypothetical protein HMPREF1548_04677 [Clostridium sp. KLE 1755]